METQLRYRRLFETAQDGILILDAKTGAITDVNPYLIAMLGYSREEFIAKKLWEVGAFQDVQASKDAFEALQENEYIRYENLPLKAKDGQLIQVEFVSNVYLVGDEQVIQCNIRDITARKRVEEMLHNSENRFCALIENSSDAVVLLSIEGKITYRSPAAYRLMGLDPAALQDNSMFRAIHPDDVKDVSKVFAQILQTPRKLVLFQYRIQHLDGYWRWVEGTGSNLLMEPAVCAIVVNYRDITERKRAEETLRQRLAELEALHGVSTALRAAQTQDEALPILLDQTLTALETDAGAIWLYHPDCDELRVTITRGWFRQFNETPIKPGEGIAGTVFATGQVHITTEFARDPVARQPITGQFPSGWSGVCLPIYTDVKTVGTLVISLPPPRQITPEQVNLLESLTEMAGNTLHRMSLYEETVHQLDHLKALHNIDLAITTNMDLRVTLNSLLEHVLTQLKVDAASVLLLNPYLQRLEYAAGRGFRSRGIEQSRLRLGEGYAGKSAAELRMTHAPNLQDADSDFVRAKLLSDECFISYHAVPLISKGQVKGVLEIFHRAPLERELAWLDFLQVLATQAAIAIDSAQLFENLQRANLDLSFAYDATIEGWSRALDLRDKETEGHTQRVTETTIHLAKAMGIGDDELVHIRRGALLHDIGKMGVPDRILLKPDNLTDEEWVVMHKHLQSAYDLISPITYLKAALDIPYCHHENGTARAIRAD